MPCDTDERYVQHVRDSRYAPKNEKMRALLKMMQPLNRRRCCMTCNEAIRSYGESHDI